MKGKLSLVSGSLSSNKTAYKHTEVILERKLRVAEVRILHSHLLQIEDFIRAFEIAFSARIVQTIRQLYHNDNAPSQHSSFE